MVSIIQWTRGGAKIRPGTIVSDSGPAPCVYSPPRRRDVLVIRTEQMHVFEGAASRQFEEMMMAHSRRFSPRLCEVIGDEQLRVAVRSAIAAASRYGFSLRGPIRLFVELMFLWGSGFHTDPQYSAVGEILCAPGDEMKRAEEIHAAFLDYLAKVSGPGAAHVHQALRDLLMLVRTPVTVESDLVSDMLGFMHRVFPQKAAYVGDHRLRALINEALVEADQYEFHADRAKGLLVVLKFAFGHGCTADPLYPWIERTLRDQRIADPTARAARLESKAVRWLERVVARNEQRSGA
jgi:hypothetical protein